MIAIPTWFSRPAKGKAKTPPTAAEIQPLLVQADADVAAAERREAAAAEREATERSEEAVAAFEDAQFEAARLRRLRERIRTDLSEAKAREAAEAKARDLAEAAELVHSVSHAALIEEATAHAEAAFDCYRRLGELHVTGREHAHAGHERAFKARQLYSIHGASGHIDDRSDLFSYLTRKMLDAHIGGLAASDPRRRFLSALSDALRKL